MTRLPLGQLLLDAGQIKADDLARALSFQSARGGRLGAVLVRMGAVSELMLFQALARQLGYPLVDGNSLSDDDVQAAWDQVEFDQPWLRRHGVLPWRTADGGLALACADPLDTEIRETLEASEAMAGAAWHFMLATDIERWMARLVRQGGDQSPLDASALKALAEDAPVIAFVNNMISQAIESRASDIHLEPGEHEFSVRLRIDGVLQHRLSAPMSRFAAISSRVKLISYLDIAERRLPQDGRVSVRAAGQDMDIRVSAIPAVHGESMVMRLLPKRQAHLSLDRLGMSTAQLASFQDWLGWTNGLILVTGPTGSGKSTTLYTALAAITDTTRKIITVEDPVELRLPNVVQIQTQAEIGYTFARALRSILRHDPDIIMVGEIRDRETAEIAIQSALTGHLVLATLHTNDALSAITRLIDMGIDPYLVAAALRATMAQRLVRRICPECRQPDAPTEQLLGLWNDLRERSASVRAELPTPVWSHGHGCAACSHTGFRGRLGLYELVPVSAQMQHLVAAGAAAADVEASANAAGRLSLRDDGVLKCAQGVTTYAEVLRAAGASGQS